MKDTSPTLHALVKEHQALARVASKVPTLEAEVARLRGLLAAPANQWGIRTWKREDTQSLCWSIQSNLGVSGELSRIAILQHREPQALAHFLAEDAAKRVAHEVAQRLLPTLMEAVR